MKNIITILLISLSTASCCISQIKDIDAPGYGESGVYYKDLYNVFDPFVGNYLYTNGNTSFQITLQKQLHSSVNDRYYEDMLIGGYRYVKDGVVKVDVLNDLDTNFPNGTWHKIFGRDIITGPKRGIDCPPNEKWILGTIEDPVSGSVDDLFIRKIIHAGQEAIKIRIYHAQFHSTRAAGDPIPPPISYPLSEDFILIKE